MIDPLDVSEYNRFQEVILRDLPERCLGSQQKDETSPSPRD